MKKNIATILLAILAISGFALIPSLTYADFHGQSLWIQMRGVITHSDDTPVIGFIGANARIVNINGTRHEWARVHAIWSNAPDRLNLTKPPTENFTFVFYSARLVNTTDVALNYSGYNLFISGLWNVVKVTTTVNVGQNGALKNVTRVLEPIVIEGEGELHVFNSWRLFELNITGIPLLTGVVNRGMFKYTEIKMCDINDDGKVDLRDLVRIAKRFNTMPGLFNYDHDMDFNENDKIDIGDLTTVAANIQG